ncbi:hypothetical protein PMAYCL1PPCAC_18931, partial [Pristionchus mayeri]
RGEPGIFIVLFDERLAGDSPSSNSTEEYPVAEDCLRDRRDHVQHDQAEVGALDLPPVEGEIGEQ